MHGAEPPPNYVAVANVTPVEEIRPPLREGDDLWERLDRYSGQLYHCNFAEMITAADLPDMLMRDMHYRPPVRREGGTRLRSDGESIPFMTLLRELPPATKEVRDGTEAKKSSKKKDPHFEALLLQFPWLQYLDQDEGLGRATKTSAKATSSTNTEPVEFDEEDLAFMAVKAAEAARAAVPHADDIDRADFVLKVRGDTAGQQAKGRPADAIQGVARGEAADEFCMRRTMQKTFRVGLARNSAEHVGVVTRAWTHNMQYFFNLEVASAEGKAFYYSEADLAAYAEPAEFSFLSRQPDISGEMTSRVQLVRDMRPTNGASGSG